MTHDELLLKAVTSGDTSTSVALRAVVALHKPVSSEYFTNPVCGTCTADIDYYVEYPCATIVAIELALHGYPSPHSNEATAANCGTGCPCNSNIHYEGFESKKFD